MIHSDERIVMVTDHHVDCGIGYYSLELAKAMQELQEVLLIKPYRDNHNDGWLHEEYAWLKKARYRSLRDLRPYILPFFLRKAMVGERGSLLHGHWFLSGLAATYATQMPVVITMHDVSLLHVSDSNDKYLNYYRWAINRFRRQGIPLIVVSEQSRQDTITFARYPEELVFAVHNGINIDHFYPAEIPKSNDRFTLVYSGGLGKRKNLDLLLKAYQRLQEKYDFLQLNIAGNNPQQTPYPALAQSLHLNHVTFTGFVPDHAMNDFYNAGDLMVYTSEYEGFGMAPLEGMACGLPVISTTGGALAEVSGGGADLVGYDVEELVEKISQVIEDTRYREDLARRGQAWVKQYTWKNTALKTHEIYQIAVQHKPCKYV
uniref:Glycosyltransferase family 1 protein n=1 Tax=Roseihalotalea indica TaxID=2867963 RepID=A0AA49GIU3_9BACT|nr:glycosyltransferase family 1 protein [Tunicatimonas sp. TK19036]